MYQASAPRYANTLKNLAAILDTSSEFIKTADDNIDVTRSLIRDSSSVLQTQIDKQGELATFSNNLALLSDVVKEIRVGKSGRAFVVDPKGT